MEQTYRKELGPVCHFGWLLKTYVDRLRREISSPGLDLPEQMTPLAEPSCTLIIIKQEKRRGI